MNVFIVILLNELKISSYTELLPVLATNLTCYSCYRTQCLGTDGLSVLKDIYQNPSAEDPHSSGPLCLWYSLTKWGPCILKYPSPASFPSYGFSYFLRGFVVHRSREAVTRLTVTLSPAREGSRHENVGPMGPSPHAQWGLGTGPGAASAGRCYLRDKTTGIQLP